MSRPCSWILAGAAATIAWPAQAQDQPWLAERRFREGPGLAAGDFELHPGLGADVGYDSNYLRRHEDESPIGSLRLRVAPSFAVATAGYESEDDEEELKSYALRFEVGGAYTELIPLHGSTEADREALEDERDFAGGALVLLDLAPGHRWSGRLYAGVGRSTRPTSASDLPTSSDRITPEAGGELIANLDHNLLVWRLGYRFRGNIFESSELEALNTLQHEVSMRGHWRFTERAALLYDASQGVIHYPTPSADVLQKGDSYPFRARLGMAGLLSRDFALSGLLGYGSGFYLDDDPDFRGVIGNGELRWFLRPLTEADPLASSTSFFALGFQRDFGDGFVGTYAVENRGYLRFSHLEIRDVAVSVEANGGTLEFPEQTDPDWGNPAGWRDYFVGGRVFGEWRVEDWLGLNAETGYTGYISDTVLVSPLPSPLAGDRLGYHQFSGAVGARVFW